MRVSVRPVRTRSDLKQFIRLPWDIYQEDPAWVPPLILDRKQTLDRKKNPFFEHAEAEYFLAEKNGRVVGRVSAHIDRLHNETHRDKTGFFGFFESTDDDAVAKALLDASSEWLLQKGMTALRGPCSFSLNEGGLLIDGFEHPPQILMGHNPSYYPELLERWGLKKIKDLYCWRYDATSPIPEPAMEIAREVAKYPGLVVRSVNPKKIKEDVKILMEVFNSAWSQNWGFVPLTEKEIQKAAQEFNLILDPEVSFIAEVNGDPAGICVALPNINEAIADLNGRLFPFGIFKLLYRIKTRKIRTGRLMLLGIKKEYRSSILGGLSVLLYTEIHRRGKERGYTSGELSWTLEDNVKVNTGIEFMGAERYKTYRVYEKNMIET